MAMRFERIVFALNPTDFGPLTVEFAMDNNRVKTITLKDAFGKEFDCPLVSSKKGVTYHYSPCTMHVRSIVGKYGKLLKKK